MHNALDNQGGQTRELAERLRQLPVETQPPYNWQEFQSRSRQRLPIAGGRLGWSHAVAAALVVVVIAGLAVWSRVGLVNRGAVEGGMNGANPATANSRPGKNDGLPATKDAWHATDGALPKNGDGSTAATDVRAANDAVRAVREALAAGSSQAAAERSQAIETWLASLPEEPAVVRVGTRAAVAGLEDRIAQVDDLLTFGRLDGSRPDRLAVLQQERARLVGSLAQVRYAEFVAADSLD
jgi:hypothetical protein